MQRFGDVVDFVVGPFAMMGAAKYLSIVTYSAHPIRIYGFLVYCDANIKPLSGALGGSGDRTPHKAKAFTIPQPTISISSD
jgi:hypothetical protein